MTLAMRCVHFICPILGVGLVFKFRRCQGFGFGVRLKCLRL